MLLAARRLNTTVAMSAVETGVVARQQSKRRPQTGSASRFRLLPPERILSICCRTSRWVSSEATKTTSMPAESDRIWIEHAVSSW